MPGSVRVAVVGPFSGRRAAWGGPLRDAMARHAAPALRWEPFDDVGDADEGPRRAREITADGGYAAVVGHFNSAGAQAALPLYRRAGLPVLLPLATRPGLLDGADGWALRWCPDDHGQLRALARAAHRLGRRRLLVAHDGSDYGRALAESFASLPAPPLPVAPLPALPAPPTVPRRGGGPALDGATAVAVCGTHFGVAAVARELRGAGFDGLLLATDDCAVEEFADLAGPAARGMLVARLSGGAPGRVEAAFAALATALARDPAARGARLLAAVRAASGTAFTPAGEPVFPDGGTGGWEVVPVAVPDDRPRPPSPPPAGGGADFFDVAVVGAGVVGSAAAAALAEAGASVVLVDAGAAVPPATHWSGGLVRAYDPDPAVRALAIRSHRLLWGLPAERTEAYGFRRTGSLVLLGPGDLEEARRGIDELRAGGVEAELLTADDVAARWPGLDARHTAGAVWEPGAGHADPRRAVAVHRDGARRHGASVRDGCAVRDIAPCPGGAVLTTDRGPLTARAVVVAAGSGTPALLDRLAPAGSAPASFVTRRIRYGHFAGGHPSPAVVDLVTGVWGRPAPEVADGALLAGRPVDEWGHEPRGGDRLTEDQAAYIRAGAARVWPWLAEAPCLGGRHGTDLYGEGGPLLGPVPGRIRTVVAARWSGGGFKTAPAAAEYIAHAVLGAASPARPEENDEEPR
ncbi:FAD-dependent oxidoreductase [Streptomyces macrosporus]|uniref:Uncharacterized protein n=1 Tax=Streptomyces macrosporus TaxID=44032 RepID=A0ABP5XRR1_9ACTN